MATFAIVRQDGEVDKVDGVSVQDVSDRFGWPGNGTIEPWDSGKHDQALRHTFASPDEQRATLTPTDTDKAAAKAAKKSDTKELPADTKEGK